MTTNMTETALQHILCTSEENFNKRSFGEQKLLEKFNPSILYFVVNIDVIS